MTKNQANWAATHDWYMDTKAEAGEYAVKVLERLVDAQRQVHVNTLWFTDFQAMRAWAGY